MNELAPTTRSVVAEADAAAEAKEWARAAELLSGVDGIEALGKRAFYLSRAKSYEEAIATLERLRSLEPRRAVWPYMIGYQYYEQQRHQEALSWFRIALQLDPEHFKTLYRAAQALHQLGREAPAQIMAGRAVRRWHALGSEAQKREERLVANAYLLLGRAQMRHDPAGAVELLEPAVEHDPRDHHKLYRLGQALRRAGRPTDAVVRLRAANRIKPEPHAGVELAAALCASGDKAAALEQLRATARRCRGWTALKAAHVARDACEPSLELEFLQIACRDRLVRRDTRVAQELAEAQARVDSNSPADQAASSGRVDVINAERNFGFLVADDGVRRHFRLSDAGAVARGQRVKFMPTQGKKGPAARDVVAA